MKQAVEIEHLHFSYKDNSVLKDVSFSIARGEFFIVIGPNGSGKTTLMKIISGISDFQKGSMNIFEVPKFEYTKKLLARKIAYVPQSQENVFPFRVRELVLMGRAPYLGVLGIEGKKDHEIADRALSFTGIEHLADRRINALSGGERQMVYIAMAVCQEPEMIILDEPTASLDFAHQVSVMDLMEKLKEEKNVTVLMVSHDINLSAMYGTRLLLLKEGKILSLGSPSEVLSRKTLESAYQCRLELDKSPVGEYLRVTPLPGKQSGKKAE